MTSDIPLLAGDHTRSLLVDDRQRSYRVHIPARLPANGQAAYPLILAFHGSGTNAYFMERFCGLNEKADEAGFVVVYPNGTGKTATALSFNGGNCCGYAQRENVDDVKFAGLLLDDLAAVLPCDERRVYVTGMSNGAVLAYRLAAEMSERIAAIAPVAGPMGMEACAPKFPVPVCHIHGDRDANAPFAGGIGPRSISKTNFYSVEYSVRCWVQANGCKQQAIEESLPVNIKDGTHITRQIYAGGMNDSEVLLYRIHGGGHTWPGRDSGIKLLGTSTQNLNANNVLWEFFQRFTR